MDEAKKREVPESLKEWIKFAKQQKDWAVEKTERGDIPPTIIVERGGELQAIIIAPQIDKYMGLHAAALAQVGFDPDALVMVVDAHIHQGNMKDGQTPEQAAEEFKKKYPKGMQHACDNENACELGEISDCLVCHRITRDGVLSMVSLPYSYHGKGGPAFKWLDDDPKYKDVVQGTEEKDGLVLKGFIPDSLRKIMSEPPIMDKHPALMELAKAFKDFSPERVRYHTARAIMAILAGQEFVIMDMVSGKHPEWTNAKETGEQMLKAMIADGFLPKEALEPLIALLNEHIGTKLFQEKAVALFKENSYWLPGDWRDDIEAFVAKFESACMSPIMPDDKNAPKKGNRRKKGQRVRVWNGDQSKYLGEGEYVGEATIYAIEMPDGSLRSNSNAEIEPDDVPEGGVVRSVPNNPKIVLDNGQTVYGCQVWWEPVEEKAEHVHGPNCDHGHEEKPKKKGFAQRYNPAK